MPTNEEQEQFLKDLEKEIKRRIEHEKFYRELEKQRKENEKVQG